MSGEHLGGADWSGRSMHSSPRRRPVYFRGSGSARWRVFDFHPPVTSSRSNLETCYKVQRVYPDVANPLEFFSNSASAARSSMVAYSHLLSRRLPPSFAGRDTARETPYLSIQKLR